MTKGGEPDFLADGIYFEVKKDLNDNEVLYFTELQMESFKEINPWIIITNKLKVEDIISFDSLEGKYEVKTTGRKTEGIRPNIDISHKYHGIAKDLSREMDIPLDDAYEKLLKAGENILKGPLTVSDVEYGCEECGSRVFFVDKWNQDIDTDPDHCLICTKCGAVWPIEIGNEQTR